ncbi:hypothetical protein [Rhizobacter sp. SG703]|uniref:hypothetical protein n=1 Tax=Rhizobacter sp. SG703 TaxID=2587140 RepID=UPI0014465C69|nr:hypothetical protein [Rhizobacter sp. SG703]NKI95535.1 hypothetical protein [Rhizobacter sp. SG703]
MKQAITLIALVAAGVSAYAGTNVGVSVSVNQPGVYGRIDIGNAPPPVVINPQPIIIQQPPTVVVERRPIYLRVPPGHQKNWGRYCGQYAACGQPVYFVREDWYQEHWRREHEHDHDRHEDHGRGHGRGHDKHDRHDDHDRDDHRGR